MDNKQFPEDEFLSDELKELLSESDELLSEEIPGSEPVEEAPLEEVPIPAEEGATVDHDLLTTPQLGDEITPNENAMAWHGMTHPTEPEPPFDLSILDDPELDLPEEAPAAEPEAPAEPLFRDEEFREAFGDGEEFDEIMSAPAQEESAPVRERPVRKGRPKRKKGEGFFGIPNLLTTAVWLAIILAIGVTLGRMLWVCAADVLAFGREDKTVTITVYQSDTIDDITEKLYEAGLIKYPGVFKFYASLAVDEGEIKPGVWDLNTRYDYHALVSVMSVDNTYEEVEITIPEGYTCRQIFALLEENKVCTAVDLAAWAAEGELDDYWFLEGVERGEENCLEGFLFPDTYRFYKNTSAKNALEKMLDNFAYRFSEEMQAQVATLNTTLSDMMRKDGRDDDYIAAHQFSVRDVIIVASMIEKETASNDESPNIASVIYNRLFSWGSTPAYLNIDASIIYALGGKTDLTAEDMKVDSPYNTYYNTGLTPGPISNPGLASIKAALNPNDTNYYYYVLNPTTGTHQFSTTLEEHEQWRAQFANAG